MRQIVELGHGKETIIWGELINLSSTGMLCRTATPIDPSARVQILMTVPGGEWMNFEGIAVRSEEKGDDCQVAITFVDLHKRDRTALERFLASVDDGSRAATRHR